MKKIISVGLPVYDSSTGTAKIKMETNSGEKTEIIIGFEKLIPFANAASIDAIDFFVFSAIVYGIDRFIARKVNSVDGWSRELSINIPVQNTNKWKLAKEKVQSLLSFLTGDYWEVTFYKSKFTIPQKDLDPEFTAKFLQVNLFSGGLDSLIGALYFLNNNPSKKILLVSHYDPDMKGPKKDQENLVPELVKKYPNNFVFLPAIKVTLGKTENKETTFRARSILFIGLAALVANSKGIDIAVPENGSISLNYPLSPSRRSACSTRTTHPTFIHLIVEIWNILGIKNNIDNPFEFLTKGEMALKFKDDKFAKSVFLKSNSCGKRRHDERRGNPAAKHCGVCMPCIYRRAALNLINLDVNSDYADKISGLNFKSKKGQDVGACLEYLKLPLTHKQIKDELLINGIKDLAKVNEYAKVVIRTREELKLWIKSIKDNALNKKGGIA